MIKICRDSSNNDDFRKLLTLLDSDLVSRHGELQEQYYNQIDILNTIVVAYIDRNPAGCGCFKKYDNQTAEIKRMFVKNEYRGQGVARKILSELEKWAKENGFIKRVNSQYICNLS
jgi:putative acetyltransferase